MPSPLGNPSGMHQTEFHSVFWNYQFSWRVWIKLGITLGYQTTKASSDEVQP